MHISASGRAHAAQSYPNSPDIAAIIIRFLTTHFPLPANVYWPLDSWVGDYVGVDLRSHILTGGAWQRKDFQVQRIS